MGISQRGGQGVRMGLLYFVGDIPGYTKDTGQKHYQPSRLINSFTVAKILVIEHSNDKEKLRGLPTDCEQPELAHHLHTTDSLWQGD